MKTIFHSALAAALLTLPALAHAHSSYLLPSSTVVSKPQWITVDGSASDEMFHYGNALRIGELIVTAPDGSTIVPENQLSGKLRMVFDVNLQQNGTYRISNINRSSINARYKDAEGKNIIWRGKAEDFEKNVPKDAAELSVGESDGMLETFITVGKPTPIKATGKGLEFVPVTHPNDLYSGEETSFSFTFDGKPVAAGMEVVFTPGSRRYRNSVDNFKIKTDANGAVRFKWPNPGMYRMEISFKDGKTSLPQVKERRLSYAAVLEVLPQ